MSKFDELKNKYADGYRCIYKETDAQQGTVMHLKNFNTEQIHTINTKNDMEIGQIEDFLGELEKIKKQSGHDCHNT
ncbi:hypothetical protein [Cellulosilyticum sp. I15G10I2]|uniref:hypothetical protein n=1 Tax=Cellulosilyticum sp. I15G10I2 TaxID=1892843 RepID=UPI00085CB612|nr:hypothetical protein [Cellulosilyticum sp. I15G10I2]